MKVKDIMKEEVITCGPDDSISSVVKKLKEGGVTGIPVIKDGKLVGIVSMTDILKLLKTPEYGDLWLPSPFEVIEMPIRGLIRLEETKKSLENIGNRPIKAIMKKTVYVADPEETIENAAARMVKHHVNRLPVVADNKLVGIIAREDVIQGIARKEEE